MRPSILLRSGFVRRRILLWSLATLWLFAAASPERALADGARLTNLSGTRNGDMASFFLTFDRPLPLPEIAADGTTLRFRLARVATDLPRERSYASFEGNLRLAADGNDLDVTIEVPRSKGPYFVERLSGPPRLAIHRPLERPGPQAGENEEPVRLVNLRGNRYARSAAVTMTFSGPFDFTSPRMKDDSLSFWLPGIETSLKPFRRYTSFEGWLRLTPEGGGLRVTLARPAGYAGSSWHRLVGPPRLLVRFLPESVAPAAPPALPEAAAPPSPAVEPNSETVTAPMQGPLLVDLLGTRTETGAVILLTFDAPVTVGPIRTDLESLRFRIPGAGTRLPAFREYQTFESWLRLENEADGLEVIIGKPPGFDEPLIETLPSPPRLRIAFPFS